jgi:hypothetical protein
VVKSSCATSALGVTVLPVHVSIHEMPGTYFQNRARLQQF